MSATSVSVQNFWSGSPDVLAAKQLMHGRACRVRRIEHDKVASTIASTFESNDGKGMSGLLKVYRRQKSLVDIRAVLNCCLRKVSLDGIKEELVSVNLALFDVTEHLDGAIDLRAETESLCLADR